MKHCHKCNRDFPDTIRFCENCGSTLTTAQAADSPWCPHCGEPVQPTWKFCATCQTKLSTPAVGQDIGVPTISTSTTQNTNTPVGPQDRTNTASLRNTAPLNSVFVRCRNCKQLVEEDATFCEHCGANMFEDTAPLIVPPPHPPPTQRFTSQQTYGRDTVYEAASAGETTAVRPKPYASGSASAPTEITAERTAPSLSMLESYGQSSPAPQFKWWHGALVAAFVLVALAALGAGGWYWWSQRNSAAQSSSQPAETPAPSGASPSSTTTSSNSSGQTNAGKAADNELKELRAWRVTAQPSDSARIVAAIEDAERKYPADYRFPYERAKLSIKGVISHHEAFEALSLAGEKAIENGKAQEMLNDLMSDKDGDFYKMSRGHREWTTLEEALRNKDKSALQTHDE